MGSGNDQSVALQVLFETIGAHQTPDAREKQVIASYFKPGYCKRKTVLLRAGETAHQVYFVLQGVLHMYYADERGDSHTCSFFMPGELATDLESFSRQAPAGNNIAALTEVEYLSISCKETVSLMQASPAFNKYVLAVVEAIALNNIDRTKDLLSLQPEERYRKLLSTRPDIGLQVPQKYIARYLGISPETLSRIRNRIASGQTGW